MANEPKKYTSLNNLQTFKENSDNLYATKTAVEELSTEVAYISVEDNENIFDAETGETLLTSDVVQSTGNSTTKVMSQNAVTNEFNNKLDKSGGTMTGALTLANDPTNETEAATKHYVDTNTTKLTINTWTKTAQ